MNTLTCVWVQCHSRKTLSILLRKKIDFVHLISGGVYIHSPRPVQPTSVYKVKDEEPLPGPRLLGPPPRPLLHLVGLHPHQMQDWHPRPVDRIEYGSCPTKFFFKKISFFSVPLWRGGLPSHHHLRPARWQRFFFNFYYFFISPPKKATSF